jgi:NAD(P)-dependent dehydrogenase (short-subunit alcohol dehydrogenase family)
MTATQRTIIVGGSRGIGLEVARQLAASGDEVVIAGRQARRLSPDGGTRLKH